MLVIEIEGPEVETVLLREYRVDKRPVLVETRVWLGLVVNSDEVVLLRVMPDETLELPLIVDNMLVGVLKILMLRDEETVPELGRMNELLSPLLWEEVAVFEMPVAVVLLDTPVV